MHDAARICISLVGWHEPVGDRGRDHTLYFLLKLMKLSQKSCYFRSTKNLSRTRSALVADVPTPGELQHLASEPRFPSTPSMSRSSAPGRQQQLGHTPSPPRRFRRRSPSPPPRRPCHLARTVTERVIEKSTSTVVYPVLGRNDYTD